MAVTLVSLPLYCLACHQPIALEYQPGPEPPEQLYLCPWCNQYARLSGIPGVIVSVEERADPAKIRQYSGLSRS